MKRVHLDLQKEKIKVYQSRQLQNLLKDKNLKLLKRDKALQMKKAKTPNLCRHHRENYEDLF